jgi:predicted nucleic-acid-binding protein
MAAVDTNVLVRWLVRDDEQQVALVAALVSGVVDRGEPLAIPCSVSLELDWVLRSRYRLDREAVLLRVRSSGSAGAMRRAPSATAGRTATLGQ